MRTSLKPLLVGIAICGLASAGPVMANDPHADEAISMHRIHVMINQALELAAEGSNLLMMGEMELTAGMEETTLNHGQVMIDRAKKLIQDVMGGAEMQTLHQTGNPPWQDNALSYTHELAQTASDYIHLLEKLGEDALSVEGR